MRVLVTGGSGFIGSHVVDKLSERGHEPVIYDLRPSPWHGDDAVETVIGSITDREALERAMDGCDAVAHLAAVADVNDVHAEPEDAEHINARGTAAVLEAARRAGVKRIAYASTIWVYSDCPTDEVDEDTLLAPPSHLYTSTKLAGELYCKAYQELYGLDYTILRFGIPYGPRAREAAVIPAFVSKALAGDPLTLAGDGMQSRKFVYVEDLADGVASCLTEVAANRVYNLASDESVTIRQIAETIQELMGDVEIVYTPARPGDFGGKTVSSLRAATELGWTARTPFSVGVRKYIEWRHEQATPVANGNGAHVLARPRERSEPSGGGELASAGEPHQHANVLVISADIGEGHDLPARAVAREFRERDPDAQVSIVNGLPAMGRLLTACLRGNSAFLFTYLPWLFDLQYRLSMSAPTRWLAQRLLYRLGRRGLMRLIAAHHPDVIVSTYPGVTAILGALRRSGRLRTPCFSSITDLAGLRYWAHPGIDLHFITHPESAEEVERIAGPGSVRWARPPTGREFDEPRDRADARRALGLPVSGRVITVSGGGWGVGDLVGAVTAALDVDGAIVLCLCGHNDAARIKLAARFGSQARLRVMGFTDRMSDVLAASDALIHSTAGLTVLEAIIRGCPVISYGFGYGHVRASNRALERFGLARVARRRRELAPALAAALSTRPEPDGRFARRPETAALIMSDERRVRPRPQWRMRTVRASVALATLFVIASLTLTTGGAYSVASHFAHIRATTAVETDRAQVGVIVNAPPAAIDSVARRLAVDGIHASFLTAKLDGPQTHVVLADNDQPLPELSGGGLVRWLSTRHQLDRLLGTSDLDHHFLYASSGPSIGQWLFAHQAGGRLVAGAVSLHDAGDSLGPLHPGEVVELDVSSRTQLDAVLGKLLRRLDQGDLHAVPVGRLMHDAQLPA
ncbi:MAG TPA: NAD-dependent epimerase/dehydratase family protein [Solirubrobacteraceae bacterium]|nr:NAD-dependent epimerase/dehydratase family protein [Solirubrobacteraceae bacterium]